MLIECLIYRNRPAPVPWEGREYVFLPNDQGRCVCEVDDQELIERLLRSPYYVVAEDAAPPPRVLAAKPEPEKFVLPVGAPVNIDQMTREQLFEYARNLGLRSPHPKISDDKLRMNLKLALESRLEADAEEDEDEDEDEAEE